MQNFNIYFGLGCQHILDWQGYDHILFIVALCGIYQLADWRKILVLVTAFTIGHTVTLALSVFDKIIINSNWIEFLIPVTIVITSLTNILRKQNPNQSLFGYTFPLFFGLIHGMGFSNYLKSLLGQSENIVLQLFAFNLGLEFGQIVIVLTVLLTSYFFVNKLKVKPREWNLFLSSAIFGISLIMAIERFPS